MQVSRSNEFSAKIPYPHVNARSGTSQLATLAIPYPHEVGCPYPISGTVQANLLTSRTKEGTFPIPYTDELFNCFDMKRKMHIGNGCIGHRRQGASYTFPHFLALIQFRTVSRILADSWVISRTLVPNSSIKRCLANHFTIPPLHYYSQLFPKAQLCIWPPRIGNVVLATEKTLLLQTSLCMGQPLAALASGISIPRFSSSGRSSAQIAVAQEIFLT